MIPDWSAGIRVRLKSDPSRIGVTTEKTKDRRGVLHLQVQFTDFADYVPADNLEAVPETGDSPLDLLQRGRFSRPQDLRRTLTHVRLTGRLADVLYSLDATGTDFYAYQFKPVLKLLNSATNGILIADEVGLGKTIEAGLIWTELRSRLDFRRVVILCPAVLRYKWQRELRQRFGVQADIVDAREALRRLKRVEDEGAGAQFALIASLQGTRPRRGWDEDAEEESQAPGSKLARFLRDRREDEPLVDLLVIDEAHYLRNPETMTAAMGRVFRGASNYVVLLSATPVHLKSDNLYQLVRLIDADNFDRAQAFDELLEANAPLVEAERLLASGKATPEELRSLLERARAHPLLKGNRQIDALLGEEWTGKDLRDPHVVSEFAYRLDTLNLLGHVITRTRKRDVTERRVVRDPIAQGIPMTPSEEAFYSRVTDAVRDYCARATGVEGFLLVMPQRQVSSSMPAALRAWLDRRLELDDEMYEDLGDESAADSGDYEGLGSLVRELVDRAHELGDYEELLANDSKFKELRSQLGRLFQGDPAQKVVLFSYFRPTLKYLSERLQECQIPNLVLHGGTENKDEVLEQFRTGPGGMVLLSSEVGSEGIDLQFCSVVINYDLPWNPMRVEQRIGRLDRIGQQAQKIAIWNLFYENTIDSRIYHRLLERLEIFERTLGGMEPVIGEMIHELAVDLLSRRLTAEQEERRIDQTRQAIANIRKDEDRLEAEAAHLVAYGDYILNQVSAARELGRRIDGQDLCSYVLDFFAHHYPGCDFRQTSEALEFQVTLSGEARFDLERFTRGVGIEALTRLVRPDQRQVPCKFENSVMIDARGRTEIVGQLHPLVRFVSHKMKSSDLVQRPAVAVALSRDGLPKEIRSGVYAFSIQRWSLRGLQTIERLSYAAATLDGRDLALTAEDAERLVVAAAIRGSDWIGAEAQIDCGEAERVANDVCLGRSDDDYEKYCNVMRAQNDDRADIQERTVERHLDHQRSILRAVLAGHRDKGRGSLVAATEGRIQKLEGRMDARVRGIDEGRRLDSRKEEVCVGVIRVGAPREGARDGV